MKLELVRKWKTATSTIGELYIDGSFHCYTLEDVERPTGLKVQDKTAIPVGTYKVVIDHSPRFGRLMPHILDVPGFEGIRIHKGNTDKDTSGCVLVGANREPDRIYNCQAVYNALFTKLEKAGSATIEVR